MRAPRSGSRCKPDRRRSAPRWHGFWSKTESEQQTVQRIAGIYDRVQRQLYWFLAAALGAIVFTSLYFIRSNRRLFAQLAALSEQRSELAQKLITTQESTLRHISREMHDQFGQLLTAMGSMLARAGNHTPEGSRLRAELREVSEIAQGALNNVRSLSQACTRLCSIRPGWRVRSNGTCVTVERQTGLVIAFEKSGAPFPVDGDKGIHVYRVVQEALNNVIRHSGAKQAWVRLGFQTDALEFDVEDHGKGFELQRAQQGIGVVAMRERAELLGGSIGPAPAGGGHACHPPGAARGHAFTWPVTSRYCWWTITTSSAEASAACSKMIPKSPWSEKRPTEKKPSGSPAS